MSDKNLMYVKKNYFWNPATCSCKNGKYAARIMEDSRIITKKLLGHTIKTWTRKLS